MPAVALLIGLSVPVAGRVCKGSGTSWDGNAAANSDCQCIAMSQRMAVLLGDSDGIGWASGVFNKNLPIALQTLATNDNQIFHEGPVLFSERHELYFTTNRMALPGGNTSGLLQHIDLMKFDLQTNNVSIVHANIHMPNGMTKTLDGQKLLVCSQGHGAVGGAIVELDLDSLAVKTVVSNYLGRPLNSPNDIDVASNGDLYFTDPIYGFVQGFRSGHPQMGNHVYKYSPNTDQLMVLSDTLSRPNGLALWEEGNVVFVSDSSFYLGPPWVDGDNQLRQNSIYAIEIKPDGTMMNGHHRKILFNAGRDIQDGLWVYRPGKLLFAAGNGGIEVWDLCTNSLLGLIKGPPGVNGITQFIVPDAPGRGTLYVLSETALWSMMLDMPESSSCSLDHNTSLDQETLSFPPVRRGIPAWGVAAILLAVVGVLLGGVAVALSLKKSAVPESAPMVEIEMQQ